jgi:hypothetical protein
LPKLWDIITRSAEAALLAQRSDGSMPPGHNGPYRDPETPVRNTAHWLITFLHCYEYTQKAKFKSAAQRCADYLLTAEARPMAQSFLCRTNRKKDFSNGLIGQAWVIEALSVASEKLQLPQYKKLAESVFNLHPFEERTGLWKVVNVDGSFRDFDMTFNHQLWFAAAAALLIEDSQDAVAKKISCFLDKLPGMFKISTSGLISHPLVLKAKSLKNYKRKVFSLCRRLRYISKTPEYKEAGYHPFNLYAMAILKEHFRSHSFWQTKKLRKTLEYINRDEFMELLQNSSHSRDFYRLDIFPDAPSCNRYGYPYNPVGFEVAFALKVFSPALIDINSKMSFWASSQFNNNFDFDANMLCRNTEDPVTLAARIYEATRLPNLEIDMNHKN